MIIKQITENGEKWTVEAADQKNLPALPQIRFECYHEGLAAQIMDMGLYSAEKPTIEKIHLFIHEQG